MKHSPLIVALALAWLILTPAASAANLSGYKQTEGAARPLGLVVPCLGLAADSLVGRRPNIIFILTDDQGYGDMSCHGHPVLRTPNMDRLHDEGIRFTDFHVSPTCSPTRAALLTGRHEFKNGVTHTILERERLTLQATTLAQVLKSAGYTTGIFGKWHLGDEPAYRPNQRGFPTLAALAGAKLSEKVQTQVEGRSLVPLLVNPAAPWPERVLFTHLGRWPKGSDPNDAKYHVCSVRTPRWHLVSPDGGKDAHWLVFDVERDYGETLDIRAEHPEVAQQLAAQFDVWWNSLSGLLVNERAVGPAINPFKELFWRQFGGGPNEEDLRLMDMNQNPATAPSVLAANSPFLRDLAAKVLLSARVRAGERIPGGPTNTTGCTLRVPGGTQNYYPAFWVRDAAMMLGGDFISADEIEGWVRIIAATQPGEKGLHFGRLFVPGFSIPDHITLGGAACWYPGAYAEQGNGTFGFVPPADDAFFFIHMVYEHWRLTHALMLFDSRMKTGWGTAPVSDICAKAFGSVAVNADGLVQCAASEDQTCVDWGFCDSIRKNGSCLMPSLLRWQAARELAELFSTSGKATEADFFRKHAAAIRLAIPTAFAREILTTNGSNGAKEVLLLSATELGRKDDVWASAYAVGLGVLPSELEKAVAQHLLSLYEAGGTVVQGQVRHIPPRGEFGGYWEQAHCERDTYQNGGFWATPTGWLIVALRKVSPAASDKVLSEYAEHLRLNRDQGAPWEWIQPAKNLRVNALYGSSVGLVVNCISKN